MKTNEGEQLIWLDYCGYHLRDNQQDLTHYQALFLQKGRLELFNKMNEVKK